MKIILTGLIFTVIIGTFVIGDNMSKQTKYDDPWSALDSDKIKNDWKRETIKKTIYFGHQSVGDNIVTGIKDLRIQPNIKDVYIGKNRNPLSKIVDFEGHLNENIDIAIMKFCFVDITANGTPVDVIFDEYTKMITRSRLKYPNIKFVHMTVPLTSGQHSIKAMVRNMIKRIINKPTDDYSNNEARSRFNKLIVDRYGAQHNTFDIALYQSVYGQYMEWGHPALYPEYTNDGGHLSKKGRQGIALLFLNNILNIL